MGRSTNYTLRYEYGTAPTRISWSLLRGDIMRRLDGSYVLENLRGLQVVQPGTFYQLRFTPPVGGDLTREWYADA